ncbi:MAG: S16 family serine protease [Actinomycetota bacterium]
MSTPETMLPPPPDAGVRGERTHSRWWGRIGTLAVLLVTLVLLSLVIPARWIGPVIPGRQVSLEQETVAQKPGSARVTAERVVIGLDDFDQPEGSILFTTVALDSDISIFDWVRGSFDDDIDVKSRQQVLGDRSIEENRERNLELMAVSKDIAVITALSHLGIDVIDETGVGFELVVDDGPSDGLLVVGDVITAIDGEPVTNILSLVELLTVRVPGDIGVVTVDNIDTGEVRDVEIEWGVNDEREGAFVGIGGLEPRATDLPLPFDVDIDSGRIGGPSAGLAFTLTLIDLLSEGDLTGGVNVAVTGTMESGGLVGPVGGVGQKAAAAHEAGAAAFIVPVSTVGEALPHARDMPVIGVATLQEALDALAGLGGDTSDLELIAY